MCLALIVCGLCLRSNLAQAQSQEPQTLHTVSGIESDARLVDYTDRGWKFALSNDELAEHETLIRWGAQPAVVRDQALWLADGSWLAGDLTLDRRQATLQSDWFDLLAVPLNAVRGAVIYPPATADAWWELRRQMQATTGGEDQLWLRDGSRVAGVLSLTTNDVGETAALLEKDGQRFELTFDQIQSIVFSPALLGPLSALETISDPSEQRIGLRDGTWLRLAALQNEARRMTFELQNGLKLTSLDEPQDFLSAVRYLEGQGVRATSLSELEPARYKHVSDNSLQWQLGVRRDVYGRPLMLSNGVVYDGLAMHSSSQVAYRWDASPARFQAEVVFAKPRRGGDPKLGSADCRVLMVRDGKLQNAAELQLRRAGPPESRTATIDVDISGAQLLVLLVESADLGSYGDHVLWLNARVVNAEPTEEN
jgi:hypothetical protein